MLEINVDFAQRLNKDKNKFWRPKYARKQMSHCFVRLEYQLRGHVSGRDNPSRYSSFELWK